MTAAALTEIRFYGHLRPQFGKSMLLDVSSPAEAVRALCAVLPGFKHYMTKNSEPGYRVVIGKSPVAEPVDFFGPSGRQVIKLVPAVAGKAGIGKFLAGAALIGLSFVPGLNVAVGFGITSTWSSIALNMGLSMALGGVSQMLAGNPAAPAPAEAANNVPSYAFNGAVNTTAQGNPVPIAYGKRIRVGSQVISTGISVAAVAG